MLTDYFHEQDRFTLDDVIELEHSHEYSAPSDEKEYLDQFFQQGVLNSDNLLQKNLSDTQDNFDKMDQDTNGLSQKHSFRLKSKFHNYQKHLIITLRKTVKIQKYSIQKCKDAIKQLWAAFCKSRIYNKSLLRILFGEQMMEQQLNSKLFKKEGFKSIIEKYAQDQIIEAQHCLGKIVLSHFQENSLDNLLNSRKLPQQTKQLFKKYIIEFIVQLRQGNVMKRLPKSRKREILKNE